MKNNPTLADVKTAVDTRVDISRRHDGAKSRKAGQHLRGATMSERTIAPCLLCGKETITEKRPAVCYDCQEKDVSTQDMRRGKEWRENSSLEKWFPFSAEKIKQLESELNVANAALNRAKFKAICLYCQKEFDYETGAGQAALADHICTCDMNPLIKGCNTILAQADELYRLVEAYLCTPNTDPVIEDHYKRLVAWFVRSKRPDGTEPRPVAPDQQYLDSQN